MWTRVIRYLVWACRALLAVALIASVYDLVHVTVGREAIPVGTAMGDPAYLSTGADFWTGVVNSTFATLGTGAWLGFWLAN